MQTYWQKRALIYFVPRKLCLYSAQTAGVASGIYLQTIELKNVNYLHLVSTIAKNCSLLCLHCSKLNHFSYFP